jgi:xanthine dehydrogenase small subunit
MRDHVVFSVNGQIQKADAGEASEMLADFLRKGRNLVGTKIVCAEGDCGACTVLKAAPYSCKDKGSAKQPRYLPVNSCIIPVASLDGASIVTVDGLAQGTELHPAQKSMIECHGSQCGFCTPGFVMALAGLTEKRLARKDIKNPISEQEAKNALTANLCRCTGYQPIVEAACALPLKECQSVEERVETKSNRQVLQKVLKEPLMLKSEEFEFHAPLTLEAAGKYFKKNPAAKLLSGGTDLGVVHNKRKSRLTHALSLHLIPELYRMNRVGKTRLKIGARVTFSEVRGYVKEALVPEFARFLDLFASPQIKNQATLVGNLANASPIGDTPPFLLVAGTSVHTFNARATGARRRRKIPIEEFFLGYRKTALVPGEFITAVEIDIPAKTETLLLRKVSQRKDLDISTVNAAFRVSWDAKRKKITTARIALGGVAATPVRVPAAEALLRGCKPSELNIPAIVEAVHATITPLSDVRSSAAYRRVVAENLVKRFLISLDNRDARHTEAQA